MNVLLSQKHYLVGGRLTEEFYAGSFMMLLVSERHPW